MVMNNFRASWRHFKNNILAYKCDDGIVEFSYQENTDGVIDIIINHIDHIDNTKLHELLIEIINDLPFDTPNPTNALITDCGKIILKGYGDYVNEFELHTFQHNNCRFVKQDQDCVMIKDE